MCWSSRVTALEGGTAGHGGQLRRGRGQHVAAQPASAPATTSSRCRSSTAPPTPISPTSSPPRRRGPVRTRRPARSRSASLIDERTKAVFCETVGNPAGNVIDLAGVAEVAHGQGVPVIADNTVPTPFLLKPIRHGADVVIHSLTKFIGGHGTTIGGIIIDGGTFPWAEHPERFRWHGRARAGVPRRALRTDFAERPVRHPLPDDRAAQHRGLTVAIQRVPAPSGARDACRAPAAP